MINESKGRGGQVNHVLKCTNTEYNQFENGPAKKRLVDSFPTLKVASLLANAT